MTATLTSDLPPNGPREHYMRARVKVSDEGVLEVEPAPSQDSSLLRTFVTHNALIQRLPNDDARGSRDSVRVLPIAPIL